jgi:hypothetical protein
MRHDDGPHLSDLTVLLERCERDTRELLGEAPARRLAQWHRHEHSERELVEFIQRCLRGRGRANGQRLYEEGRLSLEEIVLVHCPGLFEKEDRKVALKTLTASK